MIALDVSYFCVERHFYRAVKWTRDDLIFPVAAQIVAAFCRKNARWCLAEIREYISISRDAKKVFSVKFP